MYRIWSKTGGSSDPSEPPPPPSIPTPLIMSLRQHLLLNGMYNSIKVTNGMKTFDQIFSPLFLLFNSVKMTTTGLYLEAQSARSTWTTETSKGPTPRCIKGGEYSPPGGGARLGPKYARMCVSKSEGHGSFFNFKGVKLFMGKNLC